MKLIKIGSNGLEKYSTIYKKREVMIEIYQFISLVGKKEIGFSIYIKKQANMVYKFILCVEDDKISFFPRLGSENKDMMNILNTIPKEKIKERYIKVNGI